MDVWRGRRGMLEREGDREEVEGSSHGGGGLSGKQAGLEKEATRSLGDREALDMVRVAKKGRVCDSRYREGRGQDSLPSAEYDDAANRKRQTPRVSSAQPRPPAILHDPPGMLQRRTTSSAAAPLVISPRNKRLERAAFHLKRVSAPTVFGPPYPPTPHVRP